MPSQSFRGVGTLDGAKVTTKVGSTRYEFVAPNGQTMTATTYGRQRTVGTLKRQ